MKLYTLRVRTPYFDVMLDRRMSTGEIYETNKERKSKLIEMNLVEVISERSVEMEIEKPKNAQPKKKVTKKKATKKSSVKKSSTKRNEENPSEQ